MHDSTMNSGFNKRKKISFVRGHAGHCRVRSSSLPFLMLVYILLSSFMVLSVHSASTARINCGGLSFIDDGKNLWTKDDGYNTGTATSYPRLSLSKSVNADLYNTERRNVNPLMKLKYTLYLENGVYKCNLHFAEMNPNYFTKDKRQFNVYINDSLRLKSFDIFKEVGKYSALVKSFDCSVTNGTLIVLLDGVVGEPKINAIEAIKVSELPPDTPGTDPGGPTPNTYRINCGGDAYKDKSGNQWLADQFYNHGTAGVMAPQRSIVGTDDSVIYMTERKETSSDPLAYTFPKLPNGDYTVRLFFVETLNRAQGAGRRVFDILINDAVVTEDFDIYQRVGAYRALSNVYYTTLTNGQGMKISFIAKEGLPKICAISIIPGKGTGPEEGGAHAVAGDPQTVVDSSGAGSVTVHLDGSNSFTDSPAPAEIVSYEWSWNGQIIGTTAKIEYSFPVGKNIVTLKVTDDHHKTDDATVTITVVPQLTPGMEHYLYDMGAPITTMPTFADKRPVFGKIENTIDFAPGSGGYRGSKLTKNFASLLRGYIDIPSSGNYQFALESSDGSILKIDGVVIIDNSNGKAMAKATASAEMSKGLHSIEIQFFNNAGQPGLKLLWTPVNSGQEVIIPATSLFYNRKQVVTIMHQVSSNYGSNAGGNKVYVFGFGFVYDVQNTKVKFGNAQATDVTIVNDGLLEVIAPAGGGTVQVAVEVPSGTSNTMPYNYIAQNTPAIQWTDAQLATNINGPTCLAFGPDRKLYIGSLSGLIYRLTIDDTMKVTETFQTNVLNGRNILGLAFNPRDTDPNNIVFYVSHNIIYHGDRNNDGKGIVSIVSGPQLNQRKDIVTGLPVSERDHGINGLIFLQDGNMLILVGSNTNGGLPGPLTPSGLQEEKLLSATASIAYIMKPDFDGQIKYSNNDNKDGTQIGGLDVEPWCFGIKNTFSGVLHSNGNIYAPDNGPGFGFGKTSISCTETGDEAQAIDELNLLRKGHYYGHPNRARGRTDPRQCVYHSNMGSTSTADFTAGLINLPSSTDGCIEYTANSFGGQLRTQLILSRFTGELRNIILSDDGESVKSANELSKFGGLNVAMAWDGSLIACDFYGNLLTVITPNEPAPTNLYVVSVFPVRGVVAGGNTLSIWGYNFNGAITVQVAGTPCTDPIVSANGRRVECKVPSGSASLMAPVTVTSDNGQSYTLPRAYRYLDV